MELPPDNMPGAAKEPVKELVKGFRLLRLPVAPGSLVTRGLLVKRHECREVEEKEFAGRTLFVTHLDNFVTEDNLARCFANGFGAVEKVILKSVEKRAAKAEQRADAVRVHVNFARVVFRHADSLVKALASSNGRIVGGAALLLPAGTLKERNQKYKKLYRDAAELRQDIDGWMATYDARKDEQKRLAKETAVDEDGFTKVITGVTRVDGTVVKSAKRAVRDMGAFAEPLRGARTADQGDRRRGNKKKIKERPDFYRFQQREKRREEIVVHRKRVAEDTEKVLRMKKSKRFKPLQNPSKTIDYMAKTHPVYDT